MEAIRLTCLGTGCEVSHVREVHGARTQDETWLPHFASEGGKAILTGDARIMKRPHQLVAIRDCGLICVVLSETWTHAKKGWQAANVIFWWGRVEAAVRESQPGDCWLVPAGFERGTLEKKTISYDKAEKAQGS